MLEAVDDADHLTIQGPDFFSEMKDLGVSEVVLPEFEASLEMTRSSLNSTNGAL